MSHGRITRRRSASRFRSVATLSGLIVMIAVASPSAASSVLQVHLSEMLAACELIFEGRVVGHSTEDMGPGARTWVEFEVVDVLKGPPLPVRTFELAFLGGTVNGITDEISGLRVPEVGEHGIYFVERAFEMMVNPLYGWDQGRLRILMDASGRERVVSAGGLPVVGLLPEISGVFQRTIGIGAGPAGGVEVDARAPLEQALAKASVKAMLAKSLLTARNAEAQKTKRAP